MQKYNFISIFFHICMKNITFARIIKYKRNVTG